MQLMAVGAQSPGLWQSQLAAVAVRQMSGSGLPNPQPPSLYPQNEIQVNPSISAWEGSFKNDIVQGVTFCDTSTKGIGHRCKWVRG